VVRGKGKEEGGEKARQGKARQGKGHLQLSNLLDLTDKFKRPSQLEQSFSLWGP